ncbi:GntR family transcriptional regulator [Halobacillus sp. B29]|uniref:GntR family transcriptional regulator n=1 Tax=Halobacillus sp. B29 TaxID=3457432 RepID=UPI003FCDEF93
MAENQRKLPLYIQIKNKMIHNVKDGVWNPGDAIPSESQLIEMYNVSRTTIRQSIRELVQNGVLETRRGSPARVRTIPPEEGVNPGVIHHEKGTHFSIKVIRSGKASHALHARNSLELTEKQEMFLIERIRLADGKPIAFQQLFLPYSIGKTIENDIDTSFDIFPKLGEQGIYYTNIQEDVSASNATSFEADVLGIIPGEALIDIERTTTGSGLKPIEYSRTKYLPSGFNYKVEIGS